MKLVYASKARDDLILDRYVIRYLVTDTTLYILRIWHQKEERESIEGSGLP